MPREIKSVLGLAGVPAHESDAAQRWEGKGRWIVSALVLLTIPAFYLQLAGGESSLERLGTAIYLVVGTALGAYVVWMCHLVHRPGLYLKRNWLEVVIALGASASLLGTYGKWSAVEWILRLSFVGLVVIRILLPLQRFLSPTGTVYMMVLGAVMLAIAGEGFYWLEPTVRSYADGIWLAFESGATVGYGDIVPTTPASRLFAAFMALLGYGMLSLVTASIAAIFVGE